MALFTMPRMGLENGIRTIEKDNRSRVPMVFHPQTRSNSRSQGFTLIELLVTVAILGIVAAIAAPSLQSFVLNNRIRAQAAALTSSLAFARMEAITRSTRVVTCPGTASGCNNTTEWENGWLVFVDTDDDTELDSDAMPLELHGPLDGSTTILLNGNVKSKVSFIYDGSAESSTFVLCDHRGKSHAHAIQVLATGRLRTLTLTDIGKLDWPSDCEEGTGPDKKGPIAKKALQDFLATNSVRTFNTRKKDGKPNKPKKSKGKKWNNKFEQGVYFDLLLDWQKSNGKKKKNQKKSKDNRDKHFHTTSKTDPAIVSEYIRLKNKTETPYSR